MDKSIEFSQTRVAEASFFTRVYLWMGLGLLLSAFGAFFTLANPPLLKAILTHRALFWGLAIAELGLVLWLSMAITRLSASAAAALFSLYSVLNGVTLSYILLVFTGASVVTTFAIAAGTFLFFSVYGFTTRANLASVGQIAMMGLVGMILASVVNLFLRSEGVTWVLTYAGIAIFIALIAADTQKLKALYQSAALSSDALSKVAIIGALQLYLDFINLFLLLLRLFGRRRN